MALEFGQIWEECARCFVHWVGGEDSAEDLTGISISEAFVRGAGMDWEHLSMALADVDLVPAWIEKEVDRRATMVTWRGRLTDEQKQMFCRGLELSSRAWTA